MNAQAVYLNDERYILEFIKTLRIAGIERNQIGVFTELSLCELILVQTI